MVKDSESPQVQLAPDPFGSQDISSVTGPDKVAFTPLSVPPSDIEVTARMTLSCAAGHENGHGPLLSSPPPQELDTRSAIAGSATVRRSNCRNMIVLGSPLGHAQGAPVASRRIHEKPLTLAGIGN